MKLGLTSSRKKLLLGAAIIALAFVYMPASMQALFAPILGQYLGQYLGIFVAFVLAILVLWVIKKAEKHV